MRGTRSIPLAERNRMLSGPATGLAVIGMCAGVLASVSLGLSDALHIFGEFLAAPALAGAVPASPEAIAARASASSSFWLMVWNVLLPSSILVIILFCFRSWRKRENSEPQ